MSTISPNMNLVIPGVGTENGPQWAQELNGDLTTIDQHNHSAGSGVPITPDGLNISADLSFQGNNSTQLRTARFTPQVPQPALATDLNCIYVYGVDLYYNDGNGNLIQITQSGGIAGSPGSISNLTSPASASYVAANSTFVWQSDANKPANTDTASVILRNLTTNSKGLTLSPPNAMASNYSLTLPQLPASQKIMTIDSGGNMGSSLAPDNSTIEISSNQLQVRDGAITPIKFGPVGQQLSASCGTFSSTSSTYVDVTNLTVTLTTYGNPVFLGLISDGSLDVGMIPNPAIITATSTSASSIGGSFAFLDGATFLGGYSLGISAQPITTPVQFLQNLAPASSVFTIAPVAAGAHTFKVQVKIPVGTVGVSYAKLIAYEI